VLQDMLCARYDADFAQAALDNHDGCVSERVTKKLAYHMPPPELVDAYVRSTDTATCERVRCITKTVCHAYHVVLPGEAPPTGTTADTPPSAPVPASDAQGDTEWGALMKRFEALKHPKA